MSITPAETDNFTALCNKAEKIALRLIARAEQNSFRLTAKLERRGFEAAVVKTVVSSLLDQGLLNDERYASLWLRSRLGMGRAHSPRHLLVSLGKRGIGRDFSRAAIKNTLDQETEYSLLLKYLEKMDIIDIKGSIKQQLRSEGFSTEVIERYYDSL